MSNVTTKFALAAIALFSVRAFAGAELDLTAYRVERTTNSSVTASHDEPHWIEWQNILTFSNSKIRIPLARSADAWWDGLEHGNWGFDPATLKLEWLKEGKLFWISWETYAHGSGHYFSTGHVLVRIKNGQASELFRDRFLASARAGWSSQTYIALDIAYKEFPESIKLTRLTTDINGGDGLPPHGNPYPFTCTFTNDGGQVSYISEVRTIETWDYMLAGDRLKFLRGTQSVDLEDETKPVSEIISDFHVTHAALERMNPALRGRRDAKGIVVVSQGLKKYVTDSNDGLDDGE